jgi:hypothetical protein
MPEKLLTNLFADTIFTALIFLGIEVIGSIAFSAVACFIVLSSAPELSRLRNYTPWILIGTFRHSL